jgi:anti-anti-sigma factor
VAMTMSTANLLAVHTMHGLGEVVLECVGEIDLSSSGTLAAGLDSAPVEAGGRLVVDLMGVRFIDLSGVACLLSGKERCTVLVVEEFAEGVHSR